MKKMDFDGLARREIFLNPGDLRAGQNGEVFGTLLGSCVAITLWHPKRKFGCICHYILPTGVAKKGEGGRYGDTAFTMMQMELARQGVRLSECVAKVFGGGRMFSNDSSVQDIGERNIVQARLLLEQAGLAITGQNVGGDGYRRLYFDVANGDVWLKFDWIDTEEQDMVL